MPETAGAATGTIELPWAAWHGDREQCLAVPRGWTVALLHMRGAPALSDAEIEEALDRPVAAPPLAVLAAGRRRAAIAIDDITRPTPTAAILQPVLDRLASGGIPAADVSIILATGAHRPATAEDIRSKVGRGLLDRVRVVPHNPAGDLSETGAVLGGVPVRVNREFAAADLRIGIGGVMPHPFAGFSGGGKIVIPGLADLDVLARTHKFALMGFTGGAGLEGNRFRTDMEHAARQIGLHWTVNVVVDARRRAAHVSAGDLVAAHRQAAAAATCIGATRPPEAPLDALILNAYPKDSEVLQIESAFVALRNGMLQWLRPGAPVILVGACPNGLGHHGLFGPGGRLFRPASPRRFLGGHRLLVFAPGASREALQTVFPSEYPVYTRWDPLVRALSDQLAPQALVGVVACAPLQVPEHAAPAEPPPLHAALDRARP